MAFSFCVSSGESDGVINISTTTVKHLIKEYLDLQIFEQCSLNLTLEMHIAKDKTQ